MKTLTVKSITTTIQHQPTTIAINSNNANVNFFLVEKEFYLKDNKKKTKCQNKYLLYNKNHT